MEEKPRSLWKLRLLAVGCAVLALIVVYSVALLVSNDVRLIYADGAVVLFCAAIWLGRTKVDWFAAVVLVLPTTRVIQLPRPGEHSGSVAQSNSLDCGSGDRSGFCQNAAHTTPLRYRPGRYAIDRLNLVLRLVRAGAVGRFVQSRPRCFSARLRSSAC